MVETEKKSYCTLDDEPEKEGSRLVRILVTIVKVIVVIFLLIILGIGLLYFYITSSGVNTLNNALTNIENSEKAIYFDMDEGLERMRIAIINNGEGMVISSIDDSNVYIAFYSDGNIETYIYSTKTGSSTKEVIGDTLGIYKDSGMYDAVHLFDGKRPMVGFSKKSESGVRQGMCLFEPTLVLYPVEACVMYMTSEEIGTDRFGRDINEVHMQAMAGNQDEKSELFMYYAAAGMVGDMLEEFEDVELRNKMEDTIYEFGLTDEVMERLESEDIENELENIYNFM